MIDLSKALPDDETVAASLATEDLAVILLGALRSVSPPFQVNDLAQLPPGVYGRHRREILTVLAETVSYLQREGLIVLFPPELHHFADKVTPRYSLSRLAKRIATKDDLSRYRQGRLLPEELLHPCLLVSARPAFLRGDYELAVFEAMKLVEVTLRDAAALPQRLIGVPLAREAFRQGGPLDIGFGVDAERQAISDLFAGAFGYFRNATGHRSVEFEPAEASRIILFAAQLLATVESLRPTSSVTGP